MSQTQTISVQVFGAEADANAGQMRLERWTQAEANARAGKRVLKIVGTVLACSPVCLFVHVLFIPVVFSLLVIFIGAVPMYLKWSGETVTCVAAEAVCPSCKSPQKLRPFVSARFKDPMTLQCPSCGQTCKASALSGADAPGPGRMAERSV